MISKAVLRNGLATLAVLSLPALTFAGDGKVEVGFVPFGLTYTSTDGESITAVQVPGQSVFNWDRSVYVQWFATKRFALEPQISAFTLFSDGDSVKQLATSLRGNYLFSGADTNSAYLYAGGGLWYYSWDEGDGETNPFLGGGVGYRHPFGSHGSVRFEVGYERLFSGEGDEWDSGSTDADGLKAAVGLAIRF
jgi:hypothetical protein